MTKLINLKLGFSSNRFLTLQQKVLVYISELNEQEANEVKIEQYSNGRHQHERVQRYCEIDARLTTLKTELTIAAKTFIEHGDAASFLLMSFLLTLNNVNVNDKLFCIDVVLNSVYCF